MAWTTPRTWSTDELVTASMMNTHVRDNLNYLLTGKPYWLSYTASQFDTTGTSYVDVTGLTVDVTPFATRVAAMAWVSLRSSNTSYAANVRLVRAGTDVAMTGAVYGVGGILLWGAWTPLTPGLLRTYSVQIAATSGYTASVNYTSGARLSWIVAWEF